MKNHQTSTASSSSELDESSSVLEREWHAFADTVDEKLLLPPVDSRSTEESETKKRLDKADKSRGVPTKRQPFEPERRASREKCTLANKRVEVEDTAAASRKHCECSCANGGKPQRGSGRIDAIHSRRADRHNRGHESSSESDSSHGGRRHKRRSSHDRHRTESQRRDDQHERYGHRSGHRSSRGDTPKRSRVTERRRSRERHRDRSRERRVGRPSAEYDRKSPRAPHQKDDEGRHRSHHEHHQARSRRRSRSSSGDRHKVQEETMRKLMKLANDGQLDLTKISLSEVMKTIVVPREIRHNQQHAMRYQMAQLTERIEQLTGVKIPSFYCTGAVNPLVYAEQMRKRKLLWSGKSSQSTSTAKVGIAMTEGQDEKTAEKFRKLLGIRDQDSIKGSVDSDDIMKRQNEAFQVLDREYEMARLATHTHRGTGLGFLSTPSINQPSSKAGTFGTAGSSFYEAGEVKFLSEGRSKDNAKDRRRT